MRRMSSECGPDEGDVGPGKVTGDLYYASQSPGLGHPAVSWAQADLESGLGRGRDQCGAQSPQLTCAGPPSLAPTTYYTTDPGSPTKYHENGHDTFSDFVTLVCQEAGQPVPGHAPRSPTKLVSYYSTGMFPPAPAPPMARPVPVKIPDNVSPPPINMQISPPQSDSPHQSLREVRLSPPSPEDQAPRTILYTYSGGGTIALPENLSPTNLSIVQ